MLTTNDSFARVATDEQIQRATKALEAHGMAVSVFDSAAEARDSILERIPEGAQVFTVSSQTLEALGLSSEINGSGRYDAVRPKFMELRQKGADREMRQLGAAPEFVLGSVHAITENGEVVVGSGSGSQLPSYTYGSSRVIWVVGAQKIVPDLETGLRRLREYSLPLEDERLQAVYGRPSVLAKILIVNSEQPGRIEIVIVKENLGF